MIRNPKYLLVGASLYAALAGSIWLSTIMSRELYVATLVGLTLASWRFLPRGTDYRLLLVFMLSFAVFNGARTFADDLGLPVSYGYPPDVSRALFGVVPTVWLQEHLFDPQALDGLDYLMFGVYMSYFSMHFAVAGLLWWTNRAMLKPFLCAVLIALYVGLLIYALAPTAPPWLAGQSGEIPPVHRIVHSVAGVTWAEGQDTAVRVAGTNDVAAMPSLHMALTCVIAFLAARISFRAGAVAWLYAATMGFALVYLGEHYLLDLAAGVLVAYGAVRLGFYLSQPSAGPPVEPARESGSELRPSPAVE